MWVAADRFQTIHSAVQGGRHEEIDILLSEILAHPETAPSTCAVCRRDLLRGELKQTGGSIYSCPEGHGVWLTSADVATLAGLADGAGAPAHSRRRLLALAAVLLASAAVAAVLRPVPSRTPTSDERAYLQQLMTVLDDGIKNRRDVEGVMKSESAPDTYLIVSNIFHARQGQVLARLRELPTPEALTPVHDRIIAATERQMAFYRAFAEARSRGGAADLSRIFGHPDARAADYELRTAWDDIRRIYPTLDPAIAATIEDHLCRFDPI